VTGHLLVAGFATRHIVESARRAGYRVTAIDHFCDLDLERTADECLRFETLDELAALVGAVSNRHLFTGFLNGSGAETLDPPVRRLGTPPSIAARFLDKDRTQAFFERLGVPVPRRQSRGRYPVMAKPLHGSGGWRNRVVRSDQELAEWAALVPGQPYLLQEFCAGTPASVSCVADGTRAVAVATNRQLLRGGDQMGFGFAGSVTPCDHPLAGEMAEMAERIAGASGCVGSMGIDFVLPDEPGATPVAIELNPRFQGTVETVEAATGENLVALHIDACNGRLPDAHPEARTAAARRILFASHNLVVGEDLSHLAPIVADIPRPGTPVQAGGAVVSVRASGATTAEALAELDKHITAVGSYVERW
jgi:predicted ATP-grasp superfamily ATP-dependent carboligase